MFVVFVKIKNQGHNSDSNAAIGLNIKIFANLFVSLLTKFYILTPTLILLYIYIYTLNSRYVHIQCCSAIHHSMMIRYIYTSDVPNNLFNSDADTGLTKSFSLSLSSPTPTPTPTADPGPVLTDAPFWDCPLTDRLWTATVGVSLSTYNT